MGEANPVLQWTLRQKSMVPGLICDQISPGFFAEMSAEIAPGFRRSAKYGFAEPVFWGQSARSFREIVEKNVCFAELIKMKKEINFNDKTLKKAPYL